MIWYDGSQTFYKRLEDINSILRDIYQIRFIQTSLKSITIQVVKDIKTKKAEQELEKYLTNLYTKEFCKDISITFKWLNVIPPGPNGKICNMISNIKKEQQT